MYIIELNSINVNVVDMPEKSLNRLFEGIMGWSEALTTKTVGEYSVDV